MTFVRYLLVAAVIAYAGWLAWPFLTPFFEGAPVDVALERARGMIEAGGGLSSAALWVGAVLLYLIAAVMLSAGNPRAAIAYFLGFIADAVLRLAIDRGRAGPTEASIQADSYGGGELAQRSAEAVAPAGLPVDPTWLILGVLLVIGLIIVALSRRRGRRRVPGQLTG
ncbi:hypothetical protein IP78_03035 [Brevundimonas sp. AAP58]|uniref:hypothetical protein n=1 Tax=Brevundimonas sp. AAP58 TaxID=1523422 RepID=UPI0006B9FB26|nr:hypothetical protein [Brevundimonas sp. AAP58]KPF83014.1 hypothetical protein IP78_03035 [Brevundimonas sp. AAP58]